MIMKIRGKVSITASDIIKIKEAFYTYQEKEFLSFSSVVNREFKLVQKGAYAIKKHGSPSIKVGEDKYWVGDLSCTKMELEKEKVVLKFTLEKKWLEEVLSTGSVFSAREAKNGKKYADLYFSVECANIATLEKNAKVGTISLKKTGENAYTELGNVKFISFLEPNVQEVSETIVVQEDEDLPF